jgi:hypothetical protein
MTGAYLRVKRAGKWENIEVEHLTNEERIARFKTAPIDEVLGWLNAMCKTLAYISDSMEAQDGTDVQ